MSAKAKWLINTQTGNVFPYTELLAAGANMEPFYPEADAKPSFGANACEQNLFHHKNYMRPRREPEETLPGGEDDEVIEGGPSVISAAQLNAMTKAQIVNFANTKLDLALDQTMNKAQMIEAIMAHGATQAQE